VCSKGLWGRLERTWTWGRRTGSDFRIYQWSRWEGYRKVVFVSLHLWVSCPEDVSRGLGFLMEQQINFSCGHRELWASGEHVISAVCPAYHRGRHVCWNALGLPMGWHFHPASKLCNWEELFWFWRSVSSLAMVSICCWPSWRSDVASRICILVPHERASDPEWDK
jgi:hypothetical protein